MTPLAPTADRRTPVVGPENKPAKVALVAGLLSVIPGVGLVAVVAGMVAGQRARELGGVGRGRALAGVVLGVLSMMVWAMLTGAIMQANALRKQKPFLDATPRFIMLVGSGNVSAAKGMCTDAVDIDQLTETAEQFDKLGSFSGDLRPWAGKPIDGGAQIEFLLPFATSKQVFTADWTTIDGQPRVTRYGMMPEERATTQKTR